MKGIQDNLSELRRAGLEPDLKFYSQLLSYYIAKNQVRLVRSLPHPLPAPCSPFPCKKQAPFPRLSLLRNSQAPMRVLALSGSSSWVCCGFVSNARYLGSQNTWEYEKTWSSCFSSTKSPFATISKIIKLCSNNRIISRND